MVNNNLNSHIEIRNPNINTSTSSADGKDFLKILALLTMFIDHIGHIFFPEFIFFRLVGRLSFPIFAYQLTIGYQNTSNINRYLLRLFIFGLISQYPYMLILSKGLNIFFTLFLGLICIYLIDHKKYILLGLSLLLPIFLPLEYGYYGLTTIIIFYIFRNNLLKTILFLFIINLLYFISNNFSIQIFSLFSLSLIYKKWDVKIGLNKYIFYAFYPAHILVFYLIKILK